MGTTGLETAFASVYTELVVPGVLPLALVVAKLSEGAALMGLALPRIAVGQPAELCLLDLGATLAGRRVRLRVARGELLLRRPDAARARARDRRRRGGRLPGAGVRPDRRMSAAYVLLEDGARFDGEACGAPGHAVGEVVFTTGMSGYQECMTDPSFYAQLITFTAPMIGNYGVSAEAMESERVHARAAIMREAVNSEDAPSAERGWLDWLLDCGVPGITGVDTRALVRHIREAGAMLGGVFPGAIAEDEARALIAAEPPMTGARPRPRGRRRASRRSSTATAAGRTSSRSTPAIKTSIVRNFVSRGATLELLPCTTPAEEVFARRADGIFLVPGPGRSRDARLPVDTVRQAIGKLPVFGHLPRPPDALAGGRPRDLQAPVRAPRRQPSGEGPAHRPHRDHDAEPRVRGRARPASGSRPTSGGGAHAREPERRHGRGAAARRGARLLRAVPPRGEPGPARQPGPVRRVHRARSRRARVPSRDDLQQDPGHRLRPDRDRPGVRVRLLRARRPARRCARRATRSSWSTRTRPRS